MLKPSISPATNEPSTNALPANKRPANKRPANKLLGLEGLRFLATFSVLIWHYQHFAFVGDRAINLTKSELPFY